MIRIEESLLRKAIEVLVMGRLQDMARKGHINTTAVVALLSLQTDWTDDKVDELIDELTEVLEDNDGC